MEVLMIDGPLAGYTWFVADDLNPPTIINAAEEPSVLMYYYDSFRKVYSIEPSARNVVKGNARPNS